MGYIDNNLTKDEQIIYRAKIHWVILLPSVICFLSGVLFLAMGSSNAAPAVAGSVLLIAGSVSFISALIKKTTTELAVTTKRVIAKFGLIRRNTIELNHSKVESYNVDQSIAGRLFGFGTIIINGTGGGKTPIPSIDSPLEFRKLAMETIDNV